MKSTIFIPKTIKVGYQERSGTYSGKLAYVIYYDEKGVLRKEKSWNSWRDSKIEPDEFENKPIDGIVLNKKAGGYSTGWNHRNTYCRVYDSRGFEYEITIENLLYILENCNCIKGKGLEGEFVYGWNGTEMVLVPTSSPDYKELLEWSATKSNPKSFKGKDMILGAKYLSKDKEELIYLGRHDYYTYDYSNDEKKYYKKGREYVFYNRNSKYSKFRRMASLTKNIIDVLEEKCCEDYVNLFDELECQHFYSPVDYTKTKLEYWTIVEFKNKINEGYWRHLDTLDKDGVRIRFTIKDNDVVSVTRIKREKSFGGSYERYYFDDRNPIDNGSLEEMFNKYKPKYKVEYLENGKKYREVR